MDSRDAGMDGILKSGLKVQMTFEKNFRWLGPELIGALSLVLKVVVPEQ